MAQKIYELLTNEKCQQQIGSQAREYAKQYAWPDIVKRMLALYSDVQQETSAMAIEQAAPCL